MLKELVDRLLSAGRDSVTPVKVHEDHERVHMLVPQGDGNVEMIQYFKPRAVRSHVFASVDGFVDYLNGPWCEGAKGVVFVGLNTVHADLDYGARDMQRAKLELAPATEYNAFLQLTSKEGITQKDLFTLLNSELTGCIDKTLFAAIRQIKLSSRAEHNVEIDVTGIESRGGSDVMTVQITEPGKATEQNQLKLDWGWEGRIWECFNDQFKTPLRMQLSTERVFRFVFHRPGHARVLRDARQQLVEHIRGQLKDAGRFEVYEGAY